MKKLKDAASGILRSNENAWWLLPFLLASYLYGGILSLRNLFYDAGIFGIQRLECKVISVGNITVGGTGKTPMVIMLATLLRDKGYRPVVLSRGYGGKSKKQINIVSNGKKLFLGPADAGDEPVLIAKALKNIPVITGKKRYISGKYAVEHFDADVLLLDDAFQHRSLFRDIDIVLLDKKKPFGNGFVIPRGPLRERLRGLKRADIIIFTGVEGERGVSRENFLAEKGINDLPIFEAYRRPADLRRGETDKIYSLEYLSGKKVCAFTGIAEPENFRKTIEPLCGTLTGFLSFPDHHVYSKDDITKIRSAAEKFSADIILTTEKDGIKLIDFPGFFRDIYKLRIEMDTIPFHGKLLNYIAKQSNK